MQDKRMSLKEAVSNFVTDGCSLTIGGLGSREPFAVCSEIIRQGKKDLTFITATTTDSADALIAAGCIKRVESAYIWIGAVGMGYNWRRAVEQGIPNYLEIEEYSNFAMGLRFLAGAMGSSFMPVNSMLGTDLVKVNPRIKVINDPYGDGQVALVPAANPDIAFIHVQKADMAGNSQIWGMFVNDDVIARAAKKVVITCEEIVAEREIRAIPNMTAIPSYCVSAVVEVPFCSHPLSVAGYYWMDIPFRREFVAASRTRQGIVEWMEEWIYGVNNHTQYLNKVGHDRLNKLKQHERDNYTIPKLVFKGECS
ncbi:MAG: CoA transferase subunit A [Syntrophomonadaceae bacterium]|jgi:glutaconate CoA-transferase subunit A